MIYYIVFYFTFDLLVLGKLRNKLTAILVIFSYMSSKQINGNTRCSVYSLRYPTFYSKNLGTYMYFSQGKPLSAV